MVLSCSQKNNHRSCFKYFISTGVCIGVGILCAGFYVSDAHDYIFYCRLFFVVVHLNFGKLKYENLDLN